MNASTIESFESLLRMLRTLPRPRGTVLVAVDGRSGSGKSTFADALRAADTGVVLVHTDDFAIPARPRPLPSGDQGTAWRHVYDGLAERDVAKIEAIALNRRRFMRRRA